MEESNIPVELKQAICNNDLIIFVGAGLSYNLLNINSQPLKGWANLVEQILKDLKQKGYDVDHLLGLIGRYEPIKILELIELNKNIHAKEIYNFLKDFLDVHEKNDLSLHGKIFQLSNKIISTNYDAAFENKVSELRKNKAYKGRNYEQTKLTDARSSLLFKLHGCFEDADSMVLFPSDYKDLYNSEKDDAEHSLLVLKKIISDKTLLFIGTGMGDFQINNLFKEIKKLLGRYSQKHFILTTKVLDSSLDFLTPITIESHDQIETVLDILLSIQSNYENNESDETLQLRVELNEANERIETLTKQLEKNHSQTELLEREAYKYFSKGLEFHLNNQLIEASEKYKSAIELKPDFHSALNNSGNALSDLALTKQGEDAEQLFTEAFEKYQQAVNIKPDYHNAFYNWGIALLDLALTKQGEDAEQLFTEAFEKYQQAVNIKPDYHDAFYNWGSTLTELARTKQGEDAEQLFTEAFEKYQQAVNIKPDYHEALNNWGIALSDLALTKQGEDAEQLFTEAFEKYQQAVNIKPDYHKAFYNWGIALLDLALTKQGEEAEQLFTEAFEKYQQAVNIKPDDHEALNNWGNALSDLALTKQGEDAEQLFTEAFEKYQQAVNIKPDDHEAFNNWGSALLKLAHTKHREEMEELLGKAIEICKKSVTLGGSAYNLACAYALKGIKKEALKYLDLSLSKNHIEVEFVLLDEDWASLLEDVDFQLLIEKYRVS